MSIDLKRFFHKICSETLMLFFQFLNFILPIFGVEVYSEHYAFHNEMNISIFEQYQSFRTRISQTSCHFVR